MQAMGGYRGWQKAVMRHATLTVPDCWMTGAPGAPGTSGAVSRSMGMHQLPKPAWLAQRTRSRYVQPGCRLLMVQAMMDPSKILSQSGPMDSAAARDTAWISTCGTQASTELCLHACQAHLSALTVAELPRQCNGPLLRPIRSGVYGPALSCTCAVLLRCAQALPRGL